MLSVYCNGYKAPSQFRIALYNNTATYTNRRLMQNSILQNATCPASSAWVNVTFASNVSVNTKGNYSVSIQPLSGNGFYYSYATGSKTWIGRSSLFADPHATGWSSSNKKISAYLACYSPMA
jgi:hypothetical protein